MFCFDLLPIRLATLLSRRSLLAGTVCLSVALISGLASGQTVVVQQVEAFENVTQYAPVDFNGMSSTMAAAYPGVTFNAQGGTSNTLGTHATNVANNFYGSGTVAQPFVVSVFNQSANNFIADLNVFGVLGPGQTLPVGIGNGIRVTNHSYVAGFNNAIADENAIRRIDYVVNNENLVFVAGAVVGGAFANRNLPWSSRNSLAVRGDIGQPFDPLSQTIVAGKRRADVWFDDSSSNATGRVSGFATALMSQATTLGLPNATNNQVVRSLIMTGANKLAVPTTTGPWTRDTPNNLSVGLGAGKANYAESLSVLQGGERTLQTVTGGMTPNVVTNNPKGFAFGTSTVGQQAIVIDAPNGITELTASLNWNVTQQTSGGTIDTSDTGRIFANLSLDLRTATFNGGQFTIGGAALPQTGLSSNANLDNVEHLYFNGTGGPLPAGTYAFVITGDPSITAQIGFSYRILPVPEPVGALALLPVAMLYLRRRRKASVEPSVN